MTGQTMIAAYMGLVTLVSDARVGATPEQLTALRELPALLRTTDTTPGQLTKRVFDIRGPGWEPSPDTMLWFDLHLDGDPRR